jgi:type II secretory ATPase GspE/PulE/Tfp pilus assembly ATPase PilB-like protein
MFANFARREKTPTHDTPLVTAPGSTVEKRKFQRVIVTSSAQHDEPTERFGVKIAQGELIAVDGLPKFARTLQKDYVSVDHKQAICPIQISGSVSVNSVEVKRQFAIVLLREHLTSDVLEELITALRRNFEPAEPCLYLATHSVVSQLASTTESVENALKLSDERESTLWKRFVEVTNFAVDNQASDLHFKIRTNHDTSQISFRMDNQVIRPRAFNYQSKFTMQMMGYLYGFHGNSTTTNYFNSRDPLQCQVEETINGRKLSFRWAQLPIHGGVKIVMRVMALDAKDTYTSLGPEPGGAGFTPYQVNIWNRTMLSAGGGTVIAGVVNSGKSRTLQTVISLFPHEYEINTAEDPIEYPIDHPGVNQHSTSRAITDDPTKDPFHAFKLQNKRMDPDVTMIAELRDIPTAGAFRDSILAGQRGFTTLHAPDALAIPERLVSEDFGLKRDLISMPGFFKLWVYLALMPKLCNHCALPVDSEDTLKTLRDVTNEPGVDPIVAAHAATALNVMSAASRNRVERLFDFPSSKMRVRNPYGCPHCIRENVPELNGIRGRSLVAQMVEPTLEMLGLIREAKNIELHQLYRASRVAGFDSDNSDGKTPFEVALYRVAHGEACLSDVERRFQTIDAYEHYNLQFARQVKRSSGTRVRRSLVLKQPRVVKLVSQEIIVPNGIYRPRPDASNSDTEQFQS